MATPAKERAQALYATQPAIAKKRVSDRPSNPNGSVLILEYHSIALQEARWDRSIRKFKGDLQRLYEMGFRPVTLAEYVKNRMDLPPGASPVVITVDDSNASQFRMLENGSIDPNCMVGIWQDFAKDHPDFPIRASFYILPPVPFGQAKLVDRKMQMLKAWGCEVGCHTVTHTALKKLTDDQVCKEFGESCEFIEGYGFKVQTIALPFGIHPRNKSLLKSFKWKGAERGFEAVLLVGSSPAPSPTDSKFDPMALPRVQSIEGDQGITYWLDKMKAGKIAPYVR